MNTDNTDNQTIEDAKNLAKKVVVAYPLHEWEHEDDKKAIDQALKAGLEKDTQNKNNHFTHFFLEALGSKLATFLPDLNKTWSKDNNPDEKDSYLDMKQKGTFSMTLSNVGIMIKQVNESRQSENFKAVYKAFFRELSPENFKEFSEKIVKHHTSYTWFEQGKVNAEIITQLAEFYRKENVTSNIQDLRQQVGQNKQLDPFHLNDQEGQAKLDSKNNPQLNPFKIH